MRWSPSVFALATLASRAFAQCQPSSSLTFAYPPSLFDGVGARVIQNRLTRPRGIKFDSASPPNLLVVEANLGISVLVPNSQGCAGKLYASSDDKVFAWTYNPATATVSGNPTTIVRGMTNAGHITRTLLLQPASGSNPAYLVVSRGSNDNFDLGCSDSTTGRCQVRRFPLSPAPPADGYAWMSGELLAWGLRNAVGLALDPAGTRVWEVENSSDNIRWKGQDVHNDNPAEELNLIDLAKRGAANGGNYFGYPSCFTAWSNMNGLQTGDQFSFEMETGGGHNATRTDAWCSNTNNVARPTLSFQGHSAPLDIKFYTPPSNTTSALNPQWSGHAFVSFHGSWNRQPPTGYGVVRVPFSNGLPTAPANSNSGYQFILQAPDLNRCTTACVRPVGLAFDPRGRLFVSSDATGEVFIVGPPNGLS